MTKVGKTGLNTGHTSSAPGMLHFPNFGPSILAPGMWRFPTNSEYCCIYRVPHRIRKVNPSAYKPQLVILGPLHHSLKAQALKRRSEDMENTRFMGYLSMEQHKKSYLSALAQRFDGKDTIGGFMSVIQADEEAIRASYSESTNWMQSKDFIVQNYRRMEFLYNAEKLHREGIKFKVIEEELSLDVKFENSYLELPSFVDHALF